MADRARTLVVGGILLGLVIVGLVIGFVVLGGSTKPPQGSPSPSPTPTDVRAQVEQAYLHAWDVWADALKRLDASHLPEVLSGDALAKITSQVEQQQRRNQPVRVRVEHKYLITLADGTHASVEDNYVNHNVRLDPDSMQPTEKDPNSRSRLTFTMELAGGTWKISEIIGFK